jgi:hypothetical protein
MNPNNLEDQQLPQNNFLPGNLEFSKTVLPGSKLEINQVKSDKPGYSTFLEDRLLKLRKPVIAETIPQTSAEPVQPISENLPKAETTIFTPPADRFQQQYVQQAPESLFDLPLPAPLGNIAPIAESVTKAVPLFNQTLNIPTTVPNIPPANFNQVPNLNQFQAPIPAPAQNIKPVIQNNIVPGTNNIAPQTISKPTQEVQAPEITMENVNGIKLKKLGNNAVGNADSLQGLLSKARSA